MCEDIKLLDLLTCKWSTAFTGCEPRALCSGGSGKIFAQSLRDRSILQLDSSIDVFKGPINTIHTDILSLSTCYIPPPVDALVLSDLFSSKVVALSVLKGCGVLGVAREARNRLSHRTMYG